MSWQDDQGFGESYDDYYAVPAGLEYTGNKADDYYFAEAQADDNYFESQSR